MNTGAGNDSIDGGGGDDLIRAGAGNDSIEGGAGNDVLLGGDGNDSLVGGRGRDLLIGGVGADRLIGDQDDDILIGGTTSHDASDVALMAIMSEWTSGHSYALRVYNLQNGGGLNGNYRLDGNDGSSQTVFNDNDVDTLTGSQSQDWFLANQNGNSGEAIDIITDKASNETYSDTDF